MNLETSPLDHHARLVAGLEAARDNAVQQARIHAQEARTQRGIVIGILRELGLPPQDYNAERLVVEHVEQLEHQIEAIRVTRLRELELMAEASPCPAGWQVERSKSDKGELCWSAQRTADVVEVWMYDDGQVEMDNVSAVVVIDELLAVLHHLRTLGAGA
jgi:hypothetical protein